MTKRIKTAVMRGIAVCALSTLVISLTEPIVVGQTAPSQKDNIRIYLSVMDPKVVSDVFGKRIAKRYVAFQITIANKNEDFQYLIHDVSIDLTNIWPKDESTEKTVSQTGGVGAQKEAVRTETDKAIALRPKRLKDKRRGRYEASSEDKTLVRGVAEKGQIYDTRNFIIRLLQGAGTVAGGLTGVTTFGSSFAPSVAAFNGPLLSAVENAFPDMTVNQANRLNDSAYAANTVVPKQAAKVMVAFLPQRIFLDSELQKLFWSDPTSCFKVVDLRMAEAFVDGAFIKEVNLEIALTSIQIDPADVQKLTQPNFNVKGTVLGDHLAGATLTLAAPAGVSLKVNGKAEDQQINFTISNADPIPTDKPLVFEVAKNGVTRRLSPSLSVLAGAPELEPLDKTEFEQGATVSLKIKGTNLVPGTPVSVFIRPRTSVDGSFAVETVSPEIEKATTDSAPVVSVTLKIAKKAPIAEYELLVMTEGGTGNGLKFKVVAPAQTNK